MRPAVTLVCTLTFAALGVFVGYVVPGENAMQILGPGLALLSFLGGVFIPLTRQRYLARRRLHADVRRRRGRPGAADARAALVRGRQRRRVVRGLRRRRRLADEQGHRPCLTSLTAVSQDDVRGATHLATGAVARLGPLFAAVWLFFLLDPLLRGLGTPRRGGRGRRHPRTVAFARRLHVAVGAGPHATGRLLEQPGAGAPRSRTSASLVVLGALMTASLGESGLAIAVYVGVALRDVFPFRWPRRSSSPWSRRPVALSAVEDWGSQIGLAFGVMAASVAVFGIRT